MHLLDYYCSESVAFLKTSIQNSFLTSTSKEARRAVVCSRSGQSCEDVEPLSFCIDARLIASPADCRPPCRRYYFSAPFSRPRVVISFSKSVFNTSSQVFPCLCTVMHVNLTSPSIPGSSVNPEREKKEDGLREG